MSGLHESVIAWLQRNGHVLEMQVASAAAETGAVVFQGDTFVDPETGKLREQDVDAHWITFDAASGLAHGVTALIECKGAEAPWVLFSAGRQGNGPWVPSHALDPDECASCMTLEESFAELERSLPAAYAVRQVRDSSKSIDFAYEGTRQVAAAAIAGYAGSSERNGHAEDVQIISGIVMPCVVTRGPLLVCTLDPHGQPVLADAEAGLLNVPYKGVPHPYDGVQVLIVQDMAVPKTMEMFAAFARGAPPPELD